MLAVTALFKHAARIGLKIYQSWESIQVVWVFDRCFVDEIEKLGCD